MYKPELANTMRKSFNSDKGQSTLKFREVPERKPGAVSRTYTERQCVGTGTRKMSGMESLQLGRIYRPRNTSHPFHWLTKS